MRLFVRLCTHLYVFASFIFTGWGSLRRYVGTCLFMVTKINPFSRNFDKKIYPCSSVNRIFLCLLNEFEVQGRLELIVQKLGSRAKNPTS